MTSAYADFIDELQQDVTIPIQPPMDDLAPGTRAVIYLRVSSTGQVRTDYNPEGISIPAQREACLRKARELGVTVIDEYVEPGRSGTEMTKREAFQQMLARVRSQGDVDVIIIYQLSRMARNRYDDAIVMADLRKRGVTLVSATEAIDDTPVGQLMHGILATFNEYQSRQSGADIAYKMGQKARNGGTLGRAKIGYLNHIDHSDGRVIRTIIVDPERAPFVQLGFELFATGDYTQEELADELYDRGLRTRATRRHPAKKISENKISQMLRDRYYLGYVEYDGEEIQGRHEPLIDEDLFDTVQEILESRMTAQERRRVHHHYLKGSLFCGRCQRDGIKRRMIIQRTINSKGAEYLYFFCRGRQKGLCQAPHVNVTLVEDAVERHYSAIRFSQPFIADMRDQIDAVLGEQEKSARLLRKQITAQLKELDTKEENLIDLAADSTLPRTKVKEKLRDIARERRRLEERLDTANADLTDSAQLVNAGLALLEQPDQLYRRCNDQQRRLLNQAIFHALYIEDDKITDGELREPFGELHAIQDQRAGATSAAATNKRTTRDAGGPCTPSGVAVLLRGLHSGTCSSKTPKVELRGFEPLTPTLPVWCATSCATAPWWYRVPEGRGARCGGVRGR
jgi:site-specific DNA recombinase